MTPPKDFLDPMTQDEPERVKEMSDVEYNESGQAKQDLYDELMRCKEALSEAEAQLSMARAQIRIVTDERNETIPRLLEDRAAADKRADEEIR